MIKIIRYFRKISLYLHHFYYFSASKKPVIMKNRMRLPAIIAFFILFSLYSNQSFCQGTKDKKGWYSSSGGEIIFSWADVTKDGLNATAITRFSPVFNLQFQLHNNFSEHFGFFSGFTIHNVGFIYDDPTAVNTRYKERAYTFGIPVALKIGNMNGYNLFGGYEIEFPFNFKEKKFVNEDKVSKTSSWFSDKTPSLYQTFFVGIQMPYGTQLKFKYYMTNFLNKDYTAQDDAGNKIHPYQNLDANVFYVSLSFQFLSGSHLYYKEK
jgi:hypothetical protein